MSYCTQCGALLKPDEKRDRSTIHNNRHHAVVTAAYTHWPERDHFTNRDHFRAWLLIQAGHYDVLERHGDITDELAQELGTIMRSVGVYPRLVRTAEGYNVLLAKETKFSKLEHKKACAVFEAVDSIICARLGVESTDKLLRENSRAA